MWGKKNLKKDILKEQCKSCTVMLKEWVISFLCQICDFREDIKFSTLISTAIEKNKYFLIVANPKLGHLPITGL